MSSSELSQTQRGEDMFQIKRPNQRDGVDAGWRILFSFGREWPGATHRER
jgi:hypothetical protein